MTVSQVMTTMMVVTKSMVTAMMRDKVTTAGLAMTTSSVMVTVKFQARKLGRVVKVTFVACHKLQMRSEEHNWRVSKTME